MRIRTVDRDPDFPAELKASLEQILPKLADELESGDYTVLVGEAPVVTLRLDETAVLKKGLPKQHYCRKQHNKSDIIFRHNNKESLKWS